MVGRVSTIWGGWSCLLVLPSASPVKEIEHKSEGHVGKDSSQWVYGPKCPHPNHNRVQLKYSGSHVRRDPLTKKENERGNGDLGSRKINMPLFTFQDCVRMFPFFRMVADKEMSLDHLFWTCSSLLDLIAIELGQDIFSFSAECYGVGFSSLGSRIDQWTVLENCLYR